VRDSRQDSPEALAGDDSGFSRSAHVVKDRIREAKKRMEIDPRAGDPNDKNGEGPGRFSCAGFETAVNRVHAPAAVY
jgi:hypothetical protein